MEREDGPAASVTCWFAPRERERERKRKFGGWAQARWRLVLRSRRRKKVCTSPAISRSRDREMPIALESRTRTCRWSRWIWSLHGDEWRLLDDQTVLVDSIGHSYKTPHAVLPHNAHALHRYAKYTHTYNMSRKGAITTTIKHAIKRTVKLKTCHARLAQLLQPSLAFCFKF